MPNAKHLLLMVDDDEDDILFVQDAVAEAQLTLTLRSVQNGQEIIDYLYRRGDFAEVQHPHLIFLDLNMPKKDGWEALAEIKMNPNFSHIPVIVFTTSRNTAEIRQVYQLGAASFLVKPSSFEKMVELIKLIDVYWFKSVELTEAGGI